MDKLVLNGWLNLIKPVGVSSSKALFALRKYFKGSKKIGHIGTLDPFASGVLPVAIGEATKVIEYISNHNKTYIAEIVWGYETDTLDSTGKVAYTKDEGTFVPELDTLKSVLPSFIGEIFQVPPKFSANKIDGKRAYKLARSGASFELKEKQVECFSIKILEHNEEFGYTKLEIKCGLGFYIRSLARDLARKLGTFATVKSLHRSADGIFLDNCGITLAFLEKVLYNNERALQNLIAPLTSVLDDIPVFEVSSENAIRLKNGLNVACYERFKENSLVRVEHSDILVAICKVMQSEISESPDILANIKPIKGFNLMEFN